MGKRAEWTHKTVGGLVSSLLADDSLFKKNRHSTQNERKGCSNGVLGCMPNGKN